MILTIVNSVDRDRLPGDIRVKSIALSRGVQTGKVAVCADQGPVNVCATNVNLDKQ